MVNERVAFVDMPLEAIPLHDLENRDGSKTAIFLDGRNRKVMNTACQAEYEIVAGTGLFSVWQNGQKETFQVMPGDKVAIPANTAYQDNGKMIMVSRCKPAFDPNQVKFLPEADTTKQPVRLLHRVVLKSETDSVELKQFVPEDAEEMFRLIDFDRQHLSQFEDDTAIKYQTVEDARDSIIYPKSPCKFRFGVWDKDAMVGSINLTMLSIDHAESGSWIGKAHLGNNYAFRARQLLTEFGFNQLHINKIVSKIAVGNIASRKSVEKSGYSHTGKVEEDGSQKWLFALGNPTTNNTRG